ncbi:MAG TPA: LysM peptidoglycan-binding domain-containing protein [Nonomuraea sp.]|nr:LysM peptidoglycan-binding domain-containing protein [Nonomuraea sp.]
MIRRLTPLLAWDASLVAAAVVLRTLPLSATGLTEDPVLLLFAGMRAVAVIWVVIVATMTTACLLAVVAHLPAGAVLLVARALPAPLARAALATAGLTLTLPIAVAGAAAPPPVMRKLPEDPPATAPPLPAPAIPIAPVPAGDVPAPPLPPAPASDHLVRPGDNLWTIADEALSEQFNRPATDPEVARYWRVLIEANRDHIPDPDLIHPGEVVRLPPE